MPTEESKEVKLPDDLSTLLTLQIIESSGVNLNEYISKSWKSIEYWQKALDMASDFSPEEYFRISNQISAQKSRMFQRVRAKINNELLDGFKKNSDDLFMMIATVL